MTVFEYSTFKFLGVTSENGVIKAKISEREGRFSRKVIHTQTEYQIHSMVELASRRLWNSVAPDRLKCNIEQLNKAYDAIRSVKIHNNIKLDVKV